jgi:hypothetical protein
MPVLKELLKARQLPQGGNKAQLMARLHESDQQKMSDVLPPACTAPLALPAADANLGTLKSSFHAGFLTQMAHQMTTGWILMTMRGTQNWKSTKMVCMSLSFLIHKC